MSLKAELKIIADKFNSKGRGGEREGEGEEVERKIVSSQKKKQ